MPDIGADRKKKLVDALVIKMGGPKGGDEEPDPEDPGEAGEGEGEGEAGTSEEEAAAGADAMDAIKSDDTEAFTAALKRFVTACMEGYGK